MEQQLPDNTGHRELRPTSVRDAAASDFRPS
jgi:hypothetical protein